jgi:hypothetical protein
LQTSQAALSQERHRTGHDAEAIGDRSVRQRGLGQEQERDYHAMTPRQI